MPIGDREEKIIFILSLIAIFIGCGKKKTVENNILKKGAEISAPFSIYIKINIFIEFLLFNSDYF